MKKDADELMRGILAWTLVLSLLLVFVFVVWYASRNGVMYGIGAAGFCLFVLSFWISIVLHTKE